MGLTSTEFDFVENLVQKKIRYETIYEEQAKVLRSNPPKYKEAMAQIQLLANPGQRRDLAEENVDEYLAQCDDICRLVPQNLEDRVKILHAAFAGAIYLVYRQTVRQPERVQLAILKRHNEVTRSMYPAPPTTSDREAPLSKPSVEPRHITAQELQLFQNPADLHGKKFVLSPDSDDGGMYEVIGYSVKRDKTVEYNVLFDDCGDSIKVDAKDMMKMLEDSLYLPAC